MHLKQLWGVTRSLATYYGQVWRNAGRREFYGQFVPAGGLCFDIGAHVGDRVRTFTQLGARVVALEPQPLFAGLLRTLYGRNRAVVVVEAGVGRAPGVATLHVSSKTPTVSSLSTGWLEEVQADPRFHPVDWDQTVDVKLTTLDALIEQHGVPDFCKVDVEGLELDVLQGLSRAVPCVSFEYLPVSKARACACVDRLCELGEWEFRRSEVETMRWAGPSWLTADEVKRELAALPLLGGSGDVYARARRRSV